jgi:hypothetical protein
MLRCVLGPTLVNVLVTALLQLTSLLVLTMRLSQLSPVQM